MSYEDYPESDPRHHTIQVRQRFDDLAKHLREDIQKVDDPHAKAMFETAAEVLLGLSKTFKDFEQKSEPAWE